MYDLDEKTRINVLIDKSKILANFDFHFSRREKIDRVVKNLVITNQIDTYEYIRSEGGGKIKKNRKSIFFINITMLNFTEVDLFDIDGYMYSNMSLLVDIYNQINRDVLLSVTDFDGIPRIMLYQDSGIFDFVHIPTDFSIEIDEKDDFETMYNDIIMQIENAKIQDEILGDDTIEYFEQMNDYDGVEDNAGIEDEIKENNETRDIYDIETPFYKGGVNLMYWTYLVNNGVYPDDDLDISKCDEYLLNF